MTAHFDRLAVIGGGRMGEAIISGLVSAAVLDPGAIVVAEPSDDRRTFLAATYGVTACADGREAVVGADLVILAVKPQVMDSVVAELSQPLGSPLLVSIAGGVTCARLEALLPAGTAVVRVMPNTPALVAEGMSIVSGGAAATADQVSAVAELFGCLGEVIVLDEKLQNACTAISGCGPAYMALVVDALASAGVDGGLPREVAQRLALVTMRGTVSLIEQTGQTPAQVIEAVSSPGGSTVAALAQLEAHGLCAAFAAAFAAAVERSRELGS